MFKWLEEWKRRDDEIFVANWRSIFADWYLHWIFPEVLPTKNTITTEQLDHLNLIIERNFLAYLYGVGMVWQSCSTTSNNRSISLALMNRTILGMSNAMHESDNPGLILLGFIKDK